MMFIAMGLEGLSVGIFVPLLSILMKGELDTGIFSNFFSLGIPSGKNLVFIGLLVTIAVFIIKNLTLTLNLWHQTKFLRNLEYEFTNRLFKHYMKSDYIFFLQNNSGHLYRNLTEIINATIGYIKGYIVLISEIIVSAGIVLVLFYVDFLVTTIIVIFVSTVFFLIYFLTIGRISFYGIQRNIIGGELNKHLLQGMSSAKDVKILDREEDLIYQVEKNLNKYTKYIQITKFLTGVPRFLFEILMIFTFSTLVFLMVNAEKEMTDIIQYLGVFAIASFRIIPSASRVLNSFQSIKYLEHSVKILSGEFNQKNNFNYEKNEEEKKLDTFIQFKNEIKLKDLSYSYPLRKEFSLSKISMTVKKGESVGIIGETGSGKSTLINLIIGLLHPSEGKVEVDGVNINENLNNWHKKIGYVPQSVYLTDDTIRKNIAFGLLEKDIDDELVKKALEKASLNKFVSSLSEGLETIVGEKGIRLSGGQQQRIGIARALYRDPTILILDEATSSLDQQTEKKIMESVQSFKKEKTLIIITHRLSTVKNCDRIFFIDEGKIAKQGTAAEVLKDI